MPPQKWVIELGSEEWPRDVVGGKAYGLTTLRVLGLRIPLTYIIRSDALSAVVGTLGDEHDDLANFLRKAASRCQQGAFPDGLGEELDSTIFQLSALCDLSHGVIVRSSAAGEDATDSRAPGVYLSKVCSGSVEAISAAVREVWASAFSFESAAYRQEHGGMAREPRMAVLLQPVVACDYSGAVYSLEPNSNDPRVCVVSWVAGRSDQLMSGEVVGRTEVVTKNVTEIALHSMVSVPLPISSLIAAVVAVERALNTPVDIEFVVGTDSVPVFVQLRALPYVPIWTERDHLLGPIEEQRDLQSPKIVAAIFAFKETNLISGFTVIRPQAFEMFRAIRRLDQATEMALLSEFERLTRLGSVSIRPSYWSSLQVGDNLPQSGRLNTDVECLSHLFRFWNYILDEQLADYSAEVAAICGNWLETVASAVALASPTRSVVDVFAVGGPLEDLEGRVDDRFEVTFTGDESHVRHFARVDRRVSEDASHSMDNHSEWPPSISVSQAIEIANVARRIASEIGATRAEFLVVVQGGGSLRPLIWQVERVTETAEPGAMFSLRKLESPEPVRSPHEQVRGTVLRLNGADLSGLRSWTRHPDDTLVVVEAATLGRRNRKLGIELATQCRELGAAIVMQTNPLSHIAALLREYGLTVWPVEIVPADIETGCLAAVERSQS